jgi:hypothetical protein
MDGWNGREGGGGGAMAVIVGGCALVFGECLITRRDKCRRIDVAFLTTPV